MGAAKSFGIDVSHYQGNIDWFAVSRSDVKFAFVKATENSRFVDSRFERNWAAIRQVGLFRGAYHFASPGGDPETQAAHFAAVVGDLGFRDLPPVLDLEDSDGHTPKHVLEWAEAFVNKAEALFRRPLIVYTGGFWRFQLRNPESAFFGSRALWLAAYNPNPVIPKSWKNWTFWQYSDGTHNGPIVVPGVRGPVDHNHFAGDDTDLEALCNGATESPPQPPPVEDHAWPGVHFTWPHAPPIAAESVRVWQRRLRDLGFAIDVDGIYGPQSKLACLAFQRDRGLKADGIVGPRTWDACFAE